MKKFCLQIFAELKKNQKKKFTNQWRKNLPLKKIPNNFSIVTWVCRKIHEIYSTKETAPKQWILIKMKTEENPLSIISTFTSTRWTNIVFFRGKKMITRAGCQPRKLPTFEGKVWIALKLLVSSSRSVITELSL